MAFLASYPSQIDFLFRQFTTGFRAQSVPPAKINLKGGTDFKTRFAYYIDN